jgi:hypothetical protein
MSAAKALEDGPKTKVLKSLLAKSECPLAWTFLFLHFNAF